VTSLLKALPSSTSIPQSFTRCSACLFSTTAPVQSIKKKRTKRRINDPYRAAQAKQRKAANIARQATLQAERTSAMGDPIRSQATPFIQSFKDPSSYKTPSDASVPPTSQQYLNFFLKPTDMAKQLEQSKWLTEPIAPEGVSQYDDTYQDENTTRDEELEKRKYQQYLDNHANAERALQNITNISHGSSKDRTRINIQRCIEEFGRHNTDSILAPKPASAGLSSNPGESVHSLGPELSEAEAAAAAELAAIPKRVGPDTGSSEVQVAILTAKINTLADNLGKKDMHNKRNLRLLVHKRQKLLAYLRRKERGGPRWQHLVEKLGINDAMWKGEISL
jgi:ribosomal protein S15